MKKDNNAVLQGLLDSKKEYIEYMNDVFTDGIVECFQRMYKECLNKPEYKTGKNILVVFQQQLSNVPSWNQTIIAEEYGMVRKRSKCDYIPSLIRAVLILCVKVALLTNYSSIDMDKIQLRVPSAENFYHRCLVYCATELWKQPYLLYHKVRSIEQQHNLTEIEVIAKKAIKNAIRAFIPIDQLLNNIQLISHPDTSSKSVSDSESETEGSAREEDGDDDCDDDAEEDDKVESDVDEDEEVERCEEVDDESPETDDTSGTCTSESDADVPDVPLESLDQELDDDHDKSEPFPDQKTIDVSSDREEGVMSPYCVSKLPTYNIQDEARADVKEEVVNEPPSTKKIMLGSMLINKDRIKNVRLKSVKPPFKIKKNDALF